MRKFLTFFAIALWGVSLHARQEHTSDDHDFYPNDLPLRWVEQMADRLDTPMGDENRGTLDINAWRRQDPDAFVPGPLNEVLGALGLADARRILLGVAYGKYESQMIAWDRRKDPGEPVILQFPVEVDESAQTISILVSQEDNTSVITALARLSAVTGSEDLAHSDVDRWLRSRRQLLNAVARACRSIEVRFTEDEDGIVSLSLIMSCGQSTSTRSMQRAIDSFTPDSCAWTGEAGEDFQTQAGELVLGETNLRCYVRIGQVENQTILVFSGTEEKATDVMQTLRDDVDAMIEREAKD